MIALGEGNPEDYDIELIEEDEERIKRYQEESAKAKKEGKKLVWFAPDED